MQLNTKSATITNVTQSLVATATATCWDITDPTTICATLTGGSWADQDVYSIDTWMPKNLIGMGVLPLCVAILPFNYGVLNPKWDNLSYFVKVRTYGKSKYSDFATESSTGYEADAPTGLAVEEIQTGEKPDRTPIYYYYKFGRPYIDVKITWDTIADADSYVVKVFET